MIMAENRIEKKRYCQQCNKIGLHYRKVNRIYTAIHLFMFVITGGVWAIVWLLPILDQNISMPLSEPWVCLECENKA